VTAAGRWRALLAAAFALLALHNLEEVLTAPAFVDGLVGLQLELPRGRTVRFSAEVYASLAWATLLPALLLAWAAFERAPGKGAFAACWLEVVLLANAAVPHLAASVARRGYTPGVVTAALVNVPFGVFFLRRARAAGSIGRRELGWAVALGVLLYPFAIAALYVLGHFSLAALAAVGIL
jgi:hypothetical protein